MKRTVCLFVSLSRSLIILLCCGIPLTGLVILLTLSTSFAAERWTAEKVAQKIIAGYEKRMEKIDDITTITDKYTLYQKRAKVKEKSLYKSRLEMDVMEKKYISLYDGVYEWSKDPSGKVTKVKVSYDPYQIWNNLASAGITYEGTGEIDEHACHLLAINDMTKVLPLKKYKAGAKEKIGGKVWIDDKEWIIRKMEVVIRTENEEGEETTIKQIHKMEDYRKVDGMLIAHRQTVSTIIGAKELTPEKRKEIEEGLMEMQQQLERVPAAQRGMMESMIKPQMESMKKLLGEKEVTLVKKVEINPGLAASLFDGEKLKPKKSEGD